VDGCDYIVHDKYDNIATLFSTHDTVGSSQNAVKYIILSSMAILLQVWSYSQ
jgi:hypothetical protein